MIVEAHFIIKCLVISSQRLRPTRPLAIAFAPNALLLYASANVSLKKERTVKDCFLANQRGW